MQYDLRNFRIFSVDGGAKVGLTSVGGGWIGDGSGPARPDENRVGDLSISVHNISLSNDMYPSSEPDTCSANVVTDGDPTLFDARTFVVAYHSEIFRGTAAITTRSATVNPNDPNFTTWSTSMTATNEQERWGKMLVDVANRPAAYVEEYLTSRIRGSRVIVHGSAIHNARTFRWSATPETAEKRSVTDLLNEASLMLNALVTIDPDGTIHIRRLEDGIHWNLYQFNNPSFSSITLTRQEEGTSSITAVAVDWDKPADEAPEGEGGGETVTHENTEVTVLVGVEGGRDQAITVPVEWDVEAVRCWAMAQPIQLDIEERPTSVSLPGSDLLDMSAPPDSVSIHFQGKDYMCAVLGVEHSLNEKWSIKLNLGPSWLLSGHPYRRPPCQNVQEDDGVLTWDIPEGSTGTHVTYREDGRFARYPADGTTTMLAAPDNTIDLSGSVKYVTVWAVFQNGEYSPPRTEVIS